MNSVNIYNRGLPLPIFRDVQFFPFINEKLSTKCEIVFVIYRRNIKLYGKNDFGEI